MIVCPLRLTVTGAFFWFVPDLRALFASDKL